MEKYQKNLDKNQHIDFLLLFFYCELPVLTFLAVLYFPQVEKFENYSSSS